VSSNNPNGSLVSFSCSRPRPLPPPPVASRKMPPSPRAPPWPRWQPYPRALHATPPRVLPSSSGSGASPTLPWPWWTSSSNDHGGRPYPVHRQITMKATRGRRKREVEGGIRGAKVILHALSTLDGGPSLHVSESGNCVASNTRGWQKYRSHSKSPFSRSVKSKSGI
jgi:hypothetical protein